MQWLHNLIGEILYSIKHDIIDALICSNYNGTNIFIKKIEISYKGKSLSQKDGCADLVLPKKDFNETKKSRNFGIWH